jgi:hypothetical protein
MLSDITQYLVKTSDNGKANNWGGLQRKGDLSHTSYDLPVVGFPIPRNLFTKTPPLFQEQCPVTLPVKENMQ